MGRLAKFGIIRGKSVPVEGLLRGTAPRPLGAFTRECLACFGFAGIADKVLNGEDLSNDEIEVLIKKASMTVLMKLVELRQPERPAPRVEPVALLPLDLWLQREGSEGACLRAVEYLKTIPHPELKVVVDLSDFSRLDTLWPELLRRIRGCRSDLVLIGPSVERIVSWLSLHESTRNRSLRAYRLERILSQLKQLGFNRLRESSYRGSLRVMSSVGFPCELLTRLDRFPTPALYARELYKLNRLTQAHPIVQAWSPGLIVERACVPRHGGLDLTVMRALAVGTIALNYVACRYACASYLSLSAIQLFHCAGATGLFYGAVDSETAVGLNLHLYDAVVNAVLAPPPEDRSL